MRDKEPGLPMAGQPTGDWSGGVTWWSQGGGIQQQGNPFEVWDAQRLKADGYEWLADYRSTSTYWKAFDEWQVSSGTAVSDKTIDLKAASYQSMSRIEGRLLANVRQMLRYQTDEGTYRYDDRPAGTSLEVDQSFINHYVLDLGIPAEPGASQWKAICEALKKARTRVTDASDGTKSIDFQVKDIAG